MPASRDPILVLDSGLGGLTVARELLSQLPGEDIVYFGDTARLPYGSKTAETVTTFVKQIVRYLLPMGPKHIVIACNTATALALAAVRLEFPELHISGVIEPGARAAVIAAGAKEQPIIGVIATEGTVRSKAYDKAIHQRRTASRIISMPTPLLVPLIEDGRDNDDPLVKLALQQYLTPVMRKNPEVLLLGCTHYPMLRDAIQKQVGEGVQVIDSAKLCAADVARRLGRAGLLRDAESHIGEINCFVSDDPARFQRLASKFLGREIEEPQWVPPEELMRVEHEFFMKAAG